MKKILIGYLPNNYTDETHIILGPWSFINNERGFYEEYNFEKDPYEPVNALKKDSDQVILLSEKLLIMIVNDFL